MDGPPAALTTPFLVNAGQALAWTNRQSGVFDPAALPFQRRN